ncbi:unnamed protein product [Prorocentrum cordatum]|uniref:Cyclin N-terminal domain-containing protein n=1 Tax=Prorocentrum cordatum TaxID=2364126 RepID=A0ABN9TN53_9DINO|nr:unnamed protein product [Polarella glacialis]
MAAAPPLVRSPTADVDDAASPEGGKHDVWAAIEKQLEDELHEAHATMEHVELLAMAEADELRRRSGRAGGRGLASCGPGQRHLCLHFLSGMARLGQSSPQCFFWAMGMFDGSFAAMAGEGPFEENRRVLASAAAAWLVAAKCEGHAAQGPPTALQIATLHASQLSEATGGPPILADDVRREELGLLKASLPNLYAPTMLQWIDLVRARFDAVSRRRAVGVFKATAPWMHAVAALALRASPPSEQFPPRAMVAATSGLALVAAGLLRADALLPAYMTDARWQDALDRVLQEPEERLRDVDPRSLEPTVARAALEFATGLTIEEVRNYVPCVVMLAIGARNIQQQEQHTAAKQEARAPGSRAPLTALLVVELRVQDGLDSCLNE